MKKLKNPSVTYGDISLSRETNDSSALSGISSMRGDYFAKPPLQRRWQAVGLTVESRANDVRPYNVPFPKRVNNSSALPGISSMRGDNGKASSLEEVASRRLDGGVSGERCSPLQCAFSKKGEQLLCPVGHLLYERRLFRKASSLEEVAGRRLDSGVSGRTMFAPTMCLFQKGEQLLCPVGHLLYERRLFCKASSFRGGGKPQA